MTTMNKNIASQFELANLEHELDLKSKQFTGRGERQGEGHRRSFWPL